MMSWQISGGKLCGFYTLFIFDPDDEQNLAFTPLAANHTDISRTEFNSDTTNNSPFAVITNSQLKYVTTTSDSNGI